MGGRLAASGKPLQIRSSNDGCWTVDGLDKAGSVMSALHLLAWAAQSAATPAPQAQPADDECRSSEGEIVVCGSRKANERYRLKPLHDGNQTPPKMLEIALGEDATLSANLDSGGVAGTGIVPRFMVRFKLKF